MYFYFVICLCVCVVYVSFLRGLRELRLGSLTANATLAHQSACGNRTGTPAQRMVPAVIYKVTSLISPLRWEKAFFPGSQTRLLGTTEHGV